MNIQTRKIIVLGDSGIGKTKMLKYVCYNNDVDFPQPNVPDFMEFDQEISNQLGIPTLGTEIYIYDYNNGNNTFVLNVWEIAGLHKGRNWMDFYNNASGVIIYYKNEQDKEYYLGTIKMLLPNNIPIILVKMINDINNHVVVNENELYLGLNNPFNKNINIKDFYKLPYLKMINMLFNINIENNKDYVKYKEIIYRNLAQNKACSIFTTIIRNDPGYIKSN